VLKQLIYSQFLTILLSSETAAVMVAKIISKEAEVLELFVGK